MSEPQTVLNRASAGTGPTVKIADLGVIGMIALRGDLSSPALQSAVTACCGVSAPGPLSARFDGETGAVWMSPDELLLFCARDEVEGRIARLSDALAGEHHMVVDVSDARAVIEVAGPDAQELMAKGSPVDVSDAAFPPGTARRTRMAEIAALLWRTDGETWRVACFQSFARHLFDWLAASSGEGARVGYF